MAVKKPQTLVRADSADIAKWKEAATIRGISLNQFLVEAANRSLNASGFEDFSSKITTKTETVPVGSGPSQDVVLLAFDAALNQTPTLTGQRKWVDPTVLREELAALLK